MNAAEIQSALDEACSKHPSKDPGNRVLVRRDELKTRMSEGYRPDGFGIVIENEHFVAAVRGDDRGSWLADEREARMRGQGFTRGDDDRVGNLENAAERAPAARPTWSRMEKFRHALIWLRVLPEYRGWNPWDRAMIEPWDDKQPGKAERVVALVGRCVLDCRLKELSWADLVRHCEAQVGYKSRPWYVHRWWKS